MLVHTVGKPLLLEGCALSSVQALRTPAAPEYGLRPDSFLVPRAGPHAEPPFPLAQSPCHQDFVVRDGMALEPNGLRGGAGSVGQTCHSFVGNADPQAFTKASHVSSSGGIWSGTQIIPVPLAQAPKSVARGSLRAPGLPRLRQCTAPCGLCCVGLGRRAVLLDVERECGGGGGG